MLGILRANIVDPHAYLTAPEKDEVNRLIQDVRARADIQAAVYLLPALGEESIESLAERAFRKWTLGQAGKDNGVLIVLAMEDRKMRIETGYGLEGVLPDIYAKRIIENDIKPYFKSGDYFQGLDSGTDAIIKYTKGEYKNDNPKAKKTGGGASSIGIIIIIVIVIIVILRRGGGGGGGQVIGSRGVADALFWSMLLGCCRSSVCRGGWGGGSSGGGGGFGGFGGGSFGCGGSSGSW